MPFCATRTIPLNFDIPFIILLVLVVRKNKKQLLHRQLGNQTR